MGIPLKKLKGMTPDLEAKFKEAKIGNSDALLAACKTAKDRSELAKTIGVDVKIILEEANRADLVRIKGVAGVYSNLLEEAGVDTVKELSKRVPENLFAKLGEINDAKKATARPPTLAAVKAWVAEAKSLPPGLEY